MKALRFLFLLLVVFAGGVSTGLYLAGESLEDIVGRAVNVLDRAILGPASSSGIAVTPTAARAEPTATGRAAVGAIPTTAGSVPTAPATPDAPPVTLEVYRTQGLGLRVRGSPAIRNDNIVGLVFEGTWLTVHQDEQRKGDGYTWRSARLEGWVAGEWLSPLPSVGAAAQVNNTGEVGLRVRVTAQIAVDNLLGKVSDGTRVRVLEGPRSADGYEWWRVRLEGWVASEFLREPAEAPRSVPPPGPSEDRRFIVAGGMCTSTDAITLDHPWMPGLRVWLSQEFGLNDLPTGAPDDQIILFSYSPDGWDANYEQNDTFRFIPDVAQNLKAIYDAYPTAIFDIIGHSLGGAVALYFVTTADEPYKARTNSIITVDSPIAGIERAGLLRLGAELFGCATNEQAEALVAQLEPGRLIPTLISQVTGPEWGSPHIATATNTNDLVVPAASATLEGPSVFCMPMGASWVLDPLETAGESRPLLGHRIILQELPQWFRNIVKVAYIGRLAQAPCP